MIHFLPVDMYCHYASSVSDVSDIARTKINCRKNSSLHLFFLLIFSDKTNRAYWIGAQQVKIGSQNFNHIDGTALSIKSLWSPGEPNNWRRGDRICATLGNQANHNMKMADRPCSVTLSYICERKGH
mgnify:CR=1 FL=1